MLHCLVVVVLVPIRKLAWWHSSPFESTITREDLILQGHCKIKTWIKSQLTVITRVCATYGWSSRSTRVGNSKDIRYTLSNIITLLEEWFSKQSFGISHSVSKVTVVSSSIITQCNHDFAQFQSRDSRRNVSNIASVMYWLLTFVADFIMDFMASTIWLLIAEATITSRNSDRH